MASETIRASDLIIPEVWGDEIGLKIPIKTRMAAFATVDNTLVGQPGDQITFSAFTYIGDAYDIAEDEVIETSKLTMTTRSMGIKEVAKGISITDKAILTAMGNPQDQATSQLATSVARKIDKDLRAAATATFTETHRDGTTSNHSVRVFDGSDGVLDYDTFVDGSSLYGEDWDPADFLGYMVHSSQYATLRKDPNFISADKVGAGNQAILTGRVGQISGVDVVMSDGIGRTGAGTEADPYLYDSLLIRRNSLTLAYKRQAIVEKDRDIEARKTIVTTNAHYGVQRNDDSGILVIRTRGNK